MYFDYICKYLSIKILVFKSKETLFTGPQVNDPSYYQCAIKNFFELDERFDRHGKCKGGSIFSLGQRGVGEVLNHYGDT